LVDTPPKWQAWPPAAYDIVATYFPERDPEPDGSPKLRPALVLNVFVDEESSLHFCEVAYGTTNLKFPQRGHLDLMIQNAADMRDIGLHRATRFDLDKENVLILPWTNEFFDCWDGMDTPYMGSLTEDYLKALAWVLFKREQQG